MDFHDPLASLSHLFFAAWAVFAGLILVRLTRGQRLVKRWTVGLYAASVVLLYAASGLFHGLRYESAAEAEVFRRLDLSAIFLLVAGSYLPLFAYLLTGLWRRWLTAVVTAVALAGVVVVWMLPRPTSVVMVPVYAGLAAVGLVPVRQYVAAAGWRTVRWMFAAAGIYLSGATVELLKWPVLVPGWVGPHEVLHLTDIGGTLTHFGLVVRLVRRRTES
jgi:hemolysin III